MTASISEMIERVHRLDEEIAARQTERATLYRMIEWEALRREREDAEANGQIDFSMFTDAARRLLIELWDSPGKMLSLQDIREDVLFDADAKEQAIHDAIKAARKEMRVFHNFGYEIKNIRGKGYRLEKIEVWRSLEKQQKNTEKQRKN
jgi:DNA-binding response OmpR family regulator